MWSNSVTPCPHVHLRLAGARLSLAWTETLLGVIPRRGVERDLPVAQVRDVRLLPRFFPSRLAVATDRIVDPSLTRQLRLLVRESLRGMLRSGSSIADPDIRTRFRSVNDVYDLKIGALIHRAAKLSRGQDRL